MTLNPFERKHAHPSRALWILVGAGLLCAASGTAHAQNCRLHYAEAFQLVSVQSFRGQTPDEVKQKIDDLFGPRQEVCGESGYKFFLTELGAQAAAAMRTKGPDQYPRLLVTREILNRFPLQVRFSEEADPAAGLNQLRSNLGVLSTEVGKNAAIRSVLDALHQILPPRRMPRPLPKDDDAIPVTVPKTPLPAWAVIMLYEIRDHAARKESEAIQSKSALILDWIGRTGP